MNSILVPTDFSHGANNAMTYALELAQRTGASVTALYVVQANEGIDNNVYNAFFIDDYVEQRAEAMKKWLHKFSLNQHFPDVQVETECRLGLVVSTICQTAHDKKISLIVMGTTGASGLEGLFLGSTASGVLGASKGPVLVVPKNASFRTHARFVLATDFNMQVERSSMQLMREFLYLQHTGLDILHVLPEKAPKPSPKVEDALSKALGTVPHFFHYLHDDDTANAIDNFIEAKEANGLVVVAHEHNLLERIFRKSTTKALVNKAKVPILVLHG